MNCKICGSNSGNYPLCRKCNKLKEEGLVIKCSKCDSWHYANAPCIVQPNVQAVPTFIYELKSTLMTETEQKYYEAILSVLPSELRLFPQINLGTVIEKKDDSPFQNELFRNLDFLIADKQFRPVMFIEINDLSHNEKKRKERDIKVHNICEEAGIPIITLWTSYGIDSQYIKIRIQETLVTLPVQRIPHIHQKQQTPISFSEQMPVSTPIQATEKKKSGGCYVATCVYGSYDTPELWTLRPLS